MINYEIMVNTNPYHETMKRKAIEEKMKRTTDTKLVSRVVVKGSDMYLVTREEQLNFFEKFANEVKNIYVAFRYN